MDDVHLTSYKVLANLSRNDGDGARAKGGDRHDDDRNGDDLGGADGGDGDDDQNRARSRRKPDFKATGPTLESNVCTSHVAYGATRATTIIRRALSLSLTSPLLAILVML